MQPRAEQRRWALEGSAGNTLIAKREEARERLPRQPTSHCVMEEEDFAVALFSSGIPSIFYDLNVPNWPAIGVRWHMTLLRKLSYGHNLKTHLISLVWPIIKTIEQRPLMCSPGCSLLPQHFFVVFWGRGAHIFKEIIGLRVATALIFSEAAWDLCSQETFSQIRDGQPCIGQEPGAAILK